MDRILEKVHNTRIILCVSISKIKKIKIIPDVLSTHFLADFGSVNCDVSIQSYSV